MGYAAVSAYGYDLRPLQYRLSHNELWNLPARWDAGWYLGIARRGYEWRPELSQRQQSIAFFPAFPLLMRVGGDVVTAPAHLTNDAALFGNGDTRVTWGGVLVAISAFGLAVAQLHKLAVRVLPDPSMASRAVVLLATWPFALFFSTPYSEALFLLCSVSAVLELHRSRTSRSFLWGMLAGLTRSNGWALSATLVLMAWQHTGRSRARMLAAGVAPALGTVLFSLYVWHLTGSPSSWFHAQAGWGREFSPVGFISNRAALLSQRGLDGYVAQDPVDPLAMLAVCAILGSCVVAGRRIGWAWAAFPLAYLLPALVIDLPAVGRMTSVLFPAFLGLSSVLSRVQCVFLASIFLLLQLWLAARFFTWQSPS